jgi:hypothetical protein
MRWLQGHGWIVGGIVAVALALAGLAWRAARHRLAATPVPGAAARRRVNLTFAAAVLVTLAVGLAAVLWLLAQADQVPPGKDRAAAQADAVKTGATIALGTGGAAYLLLAYRRQRLEEVDTRERRITELFTKAVEELGHDKAPVRLGALYSLVRLAQNNPEHRQTVVDVLCAYLRMPYTLPAQTELDAEQAEEAAPPAEDGIPAAHPPPGQDYAEQELQVRQTAQRLLADHLQAPEGTSSKTAQQCQPSPWQAFWPGITLDLTGAILVDFHFEEVSVIQAQFRGATFQGRTKFSGTTFQGNAQFRGTTFQGTAEFDVTAFQGRRIWFEGAIFQGDVWFSWATFEGKAEFGGATFQGTAWFYGVIFEDDVGFEEATFQGDVRFDEATFEEDIGLDGVRVLHLDDPHLKEHRVWPDGLTIRRDGADPTRGTLVLAEQAKEPEPNHPPVEPPADNGLGAG